MKKQIPPIVLLLTCFVVISMPAKGQGVYRSKDNTVTTSVTKKRTTIEIEEKVKEKKEKKPDLLRNGWLLGANLGFLTTYRGIGVDVGINAGYLYNHLYLGLLGNCGGRYYGGASAQIHYYFGRGNWNPYVGLEGGFHFGIESADPGAILRALAGVRYGINEKWAINGAIGLHAYMGGGFTSRIGVSYQF